MELCELDLRLSVFEGATPSIGALSLYARLRAVPRALPAHPAEFLVLCRDESACPPSWISNSEVTDQDVVWLTRLLGAAGFPKRRPRVAPNPSLLGMGPYVALEARMQGRAASLDITLEQAGFSGEDAEPLRTVFRRLVELTPSSRRPAVQGVVDRLVLERRLLTRPGPSRDGTGRGDVIWRRQSAEDWLAGPARGAAGRNDERGFTPPASWEFLTGP